MTGSSQAGQTQSGQAEPQMVTEKPRPAPRQGQPGTLIDDTTTKPPPQH
jgi:hypothetical protein